VRKRNKGTNKCLDRHPQNLVKMDRNASAIMIESLSYDSHEHMSRGIKSTGSRLLSPCNSMITSESDHDTVPLSPASVVSLEISHGDENASGLKVPTVPLSVHVEKNSTNDTTETNILPTLGAGASPPTAISKILISGFADVQLILNKSFSLIDAADDDATVSGVETVARERAVDVVPATSKAFGSPFSALSQSKLGNVGLFVSPPAFSVDKGDGKGLVQRKTLGVPMI